MSVRDHTDPACAAGQPDDSIEAMIEGRPRSIGAFSVGRVLPSPLRRTVGSYIFFDHMGPAELGPGQGVEVRPHPHINLATVTYLFEGEIDHRDSLGNHQTITPGAINWMVAGRGIVHSERSSSEQLSQTTRLDGIQLWVALPQSSEEVEPSFSHHPASSLPVARRGDISARVLIGELFGQTSPVEVFHPMVYAELSMPAGTTLEVPESVPERALYVAHGALRIGTQPVGERCMAVLRPGPVTPVHADKDSRVMLIGGAPLDGPRHIFWNFVSSSKDRIERAKDDWKQGRFPKVPGDEEEFIPLPD